MARKPAKKKAPNNEALETAGALTEAYIKLRATIRKVDEMHKERTAPLREKLDELAGQLLEKLDENGVDNMATKVGTVYRTTKSTATVKDGEAFIDFIIEEGYIDLLERKASVAAVKKYLEDNGELPPGVELNQFVAVGVRKKS